MRRIRFQLVSDDQVLVDALVHRLAQEPDRPEVEQRHGLDAHAASDVGVDRTVLVVVDARSVVGHWSSLADAVTAAAPESRVVILADTNDADDAVQAGRRCLAAWVRPDAGVDQVLETVRAVADGHTVYPSIVLGAVLRRLADDVRAAGTADGPLGTLTERERNVLSCLVEGHPGKDIAGHLEIAPNTVRTHTSRIFRKLGVHSRLEAVRFAREHGFVPGSALHVPRSTSRTPSASHIHLVPNADGPGPEPRLTRSDDDD